MAEVQLVKDLFEGNEPRIFRGGSQWGVRSESDQRSVPANFFSLPNAKVIVGEREIIYMTKEWQYIPELYPKPWPYARHLVLPGRSLEINVEGLARRELTGSVYMPYIVAGNWFHILFDNYARLHFLHYLEGEATVPVGEPFWGAPKRTPVQSDRAMIHAAFMQGHKSVQLQKGIYEIERLIAPPLANAEDYFCVEPVRFVAEQLSRFSTGKQVRHPLRLFVSRSDINVRNLINEDELTAELRRLGFMILCPGDFSFSVQLELFAAAEIIVGVHGQGLTPMISARNCRVIMEFEAYNWNFTAYRSLAQALGIQYRKLPCDLVEHRNPARFDWLARAQIRESVAEIEHALSEIESFNSLPKTF